MGAEDEISSKGSSRVDLPQTAEKSFDEPVVAQSNKLFARHNNRTTFETESLESYYKPIDTYEGRHRYDPEFQWTPAEERRVVRKVERPSSCSIQQALIVAD
jgi:hypothetical protein